MGSLVPGARAGFGADLDLRALRGEVTVSIEVPKDGLAGPQEAKMGLEQNKELVGRFTQAINSADWNALDDVLTEGFQRHCQATPDVKVESLEDFKLLQQSFLETFPDQRVTVDTLIA